MQFSRSVVPAFGWLLLTTVTHAESGTVAVGVQTSVKPGANADSKAGAPTALQGAASTSASQVRRDAKGKKGINPFWEAIRRGDEAARTQDFAVADAAYTAAIGIEPKSALAHFRRGQILVRAGKLSDAEAAYQVALQLSDAAGQKDATQHAAALFVLADLKERQGKRDEAVAAWSAYSAYLKQEPGAKGYPESATERDKRLKAYAALATDSALVRERITLRLKEVDAANKRRAAKNPNEGR
jgi:tetratricopeptide (TPR) repeat protein